MGKGREDAAVEGTADGRPGHQGLLSSLETAWNLVPKETSREHSRYLLRSGGSQDRGSVQGSLRPPETWALGVNVMEAKQ